MEIDVLKLKEEVEKLSALEDEYYDIYLNLYNELSKISGYWVSDKANVFFDDLSSEKKSTEMVINDIISLKEIYVYLVDSYQELGDKIFCQLENKRQLLNKIDSFRGKISKIISKYNNLDLSGIEMANKLISEKEKFISMRSNLDVIKREVTDNLLAVEEIEKEVSAKISKININILLETDISNLIS